MFLPILLLLAQSSRSTVDLLELQFAQFRREQAERQQYERVVRPRIELEEWRKCMAQVDLAASKYFDARTVNVLPERERAAFWKAVKKFEKCDQHKKE